MRKLMDELRIAELVAQLADRLLADPTLQAIPPEDLCLVGIRSRGELLAERIAARIKTLRQIDLPVGALDITMYRDDFARRMASGATGKAMGVVIPQGTEINFRVEGKIVILCDDVLATGRSVRAALDAITDFGRPNLIRLLALIDRGGREYPITADYIGAHVDVEGAQKVFVKLKPTDPEDAVYLDKKKGAQDEL